MFSLIMSAIPSFTRRRFISTVAVAGVSVPFLARCARPSAQSNYQIGAYTRAWGPRDYRVSLDGMVETGYRYAGISVHGVGDSGRMGRVLDRDSSSEAAAEVGHEIRSRGLRIVTLSAGSFDAAASIDEGIAQLRRLVDIAVICEAPSLQINDPAKPDVEASFYRVVAECCDYAAGRNVGLTIHPHGSSGAHIRAQIEKVGHRNLRLMYDPGNIGFYSNGEINPVEDADALDGILYGMSVKDYRLPRNVNVTPGSGLVDFPALMTRLQRGGFTSGPLVVECLDPKELDQVNAEARKAREFIERIVA
jgi:sugar phosphate isomerase/epimerase